MILVSLSCRKLCSETMTCIQPENCSNLVLGLEFQKFDSMMTISPESNCNLVSGLEVPKFYFEKGS